MPAGLAYLLLLIFVSRPVALAFTLPVGVFTAYFAWRFVDRRMLAFYPVVLAGSLMSAAYSDGGYLYVKHEPQPEGRIRIVGKDGGGDYRVMSTSSQASPKGRISLVSLTEIGNTTPQYWVEYYVLPSNFNALISDPRVAAHSA